MKGILMVQKPDPRPLIIVKRPSPDFAEYAMIEAGKQVKNGIFMGQPL